MELTRKSFKKLIYLIFLPLLLVACSSDDDNPSNTSETSLNFDFALTSDQVPTLPSVISDGKGTGSFSVDVATKVLSGFITITGLTTPPTAVHIHPGAVGETDAFIITLEQDTTTTNSIRYNIPNDSIPDGSILDGSILNEDDYAKLISGGLYVNVHSSASPTGDILRGQIISDNQIVLVSEGDSSQVIGLAASNATGKAYLLLDTNDGAISGNIQVQGISATNMHIHAGLAGNIGEPAVFFDESSDPNLRNVNAGSSLSSPEGISAILAGEYYFNVHSGNGEFRGQITTDDIEIFTVPLAAATDVVDTAATGTGYVTLNTKSGDIKSTVRVKDIAATQMHIHNSKSDGAAIATYSEPALGDDANVWHLNAGSELTSGEIKNLQDGETYINVHIGTGASIAVELTGIINENKSALIE